MEKNRENLIASEKLANKIEKKQKTKNKIYQESLLHSSRIHTFYELKF